MTHLVRVVALPVLATLCSVTAAFAVQTATAREIAAPAAPADAKATQDYTLGPGDLLTVRIVGIGKYEGIRVSNSGKVHVPHVGVLRVFGSTVPELEATIAQGLRERGLVKEPWVQVNLEKPLSKPVYILGEVIVPGQFVITDEMHVLDLVTLGGGFNEMATPVGYLYRRSPGRVSADDPAASYNSTDWSDEVIEIDFERIASGQDPNVKLQGGDVLYVPERRKLAFYVAGDVARPGAFQYPQKGSHRMSAVSSIAVSQRPLRVSEAVAKAGGALKTARTSDCVLVRFDQAGARHEGRFDLAKVLQGREPDPLVEPNDIIYVPGSTAKSLGYSFLKIIPTVLVGGLVY